MIETFGNAVSLASLNSEQNFFLLRIVHLYLYMISFGKRLVMIGGIVAAASVIAATLLLAEWQVKVDTTTTILAFLFVWQNICK